MSVGPGLQRRQEPRPYISPTAFRVVNLGLQTRVVVIDSGLDTERRRENANGAHSAPKERLPGLGCLPPIHLTPRQVESCLCRLGQDGLSIVNHINTKRLQDLH